MRYNLPPLNALKAFEATGRMGSLSAAARELRVSVGAVSRHVSILETYFACELFERRHDGVGLTQWGKPLHAAISTAFQTIDSACRDVDYGTSRPIRLRTFTSMATDWLTPRLGEFRSAKPNVSVQLKQAFSEISFTADPLDAAVTAQIILESGIDQIELFPTIFTPVAAPFVKTDSPAEHLTGPNALPLLFTRREIPFWETVFDEIGLPPPAFDRGLEFDSLSLTYQAARRGAGVALGLLFFVADDFAAGTLVPASRICVDMQLPQYLYVRTDRKKHPDTESFASWVQAQAARTNAELESLFGSIIASPVTVIKSH
ncbi:LysR substrate-binding domain-containing protein [Hyphomonas adhaerens]|nr:LysR substrate-binding domain-containing protein [Hyphomonas adhaerens]